MRVSDRLTVKMTVKVCGAADIALRINSLEGSSMIEWGIDSVLAPAMNNRHPL